MADYGHMVAGMSGGVVSTLILHPLDLVKVRMQGQLMSIHHVYQTKLTSRSRDLDKARLAYKSVPLGRAAARATRLVHRGEPQRPCLGDCVGFLFLHVQRN